MNAEADRLRWHREVEAEGNTESERRRPKTIAGRAAAVRKVADRAFYAGNLDEYFDLNHAAAVLEVESDRRDGTRLTSYGQSSYTQDKP